MYFTMFTTTLDQIKNFVDF